MTMLFSKDFTSFVLQLIVTIKGSRFTGEIENLISSCEAHQGSVFGLNFLISTSDAA